MSNSTIYDESKPKGNMTDASTDVKTRRRHNDICKKYGNKLRCLAYSTIVRAEYGYEIFLSKKDLEEQRKMDREHYEGLNEMCDQCNKKYSKEE